MIKTTTAKVADNATITVGLDTLIAPYAPPKTSAIIHSCDKCATTVFEVKGGMLIIERTHHGERHTTLVSIAELFKQYALANVGTALPMMDFYGGAG